MKYGLTKYLFSISLTPLKSFRFCDLAACEKTLSLITISLLLLSSVLKTHRRSEISPSDVCALGADARQRLGVGDASQPHSTRDTGDTAAVVRRGGRARSVGPGETGADA